MPWLQWLTRDEDIKRAKVAPYRLLEAEPELSAGDPRSPNMLIQGDNLEALKALLPYYASRVKCIYIDPPYNTRTTFEHYDDSLEHSQWLSVLYPTFHSASDRRPAAFGGRLVLPGLCGIAERRTRSHRRVQRPAPHERSRHETKGQCRRLMGNKKPGSRIVPDG